MKTYAPTDSIAATVETIEKRKSITNNSCGRCGGRHPRQSCPAIGAECHKCGLKNHFSRVCRTKHSTNTRRPTPKRTIHNLEEESSDEDDANLYIHAVETTETKSEDATLTLNDKSVTFRLDTGAECNVISKKTYDRISKRPPQRTRTKLIAFGGHRLNTCGKATILSEYKDKYRVLEFMIVNGNIQNILSHAQN